MNERLQELSFDVTDYERPSEKWACGWAADGAPCTGVPTPDGRCWVRKKTAGDAPPTYCKPRKVQGAFVCSLARHQGGPCTEGPGAMGACSHPIPPCQPVLTIRASRGRVVWLATAATLGVIVAFVSTTVPRRLLINPGDLTESHRQALATIGSGDRCAVCHIQSASTWGAWLTQGLASPSTVCTGGAGGSCGRDEDCPATCRGGSADGRGCNPLDSSSDCIRGGGVCPPRACGPISMGGLCLRCHDLGTYEEASHAHGAGGRELDRLTRFKETRRNARDDGTVHGSSLVASAARWAGPGSFSASGPLDCTACHKEHRGRDHDLKTLSDAQCQICHVISFNSFVDGHPEVFPSYSFARRPATKFDHISHYEKEGFEAQGQRMTCDACHQLDARGRGMTLHGFDISCRHCHSIEEYWGPPVKLLELPAADPEEESVGAWLEDLDPSDLTPLLRILLFAVGNHDEVSRLKSAVNAWEEGAEGWEDVLPAEVSRLLKDLPDSAGLADRLARALQGGSGAANSEALHDVSEKLARAFRRRHEALGSASRPEAKPMGGVEPNSEADPWILSASGISYQPRRHGDRFVKAWLDATAHYAGSVTPAPLGEDLRAMFEVFGAEDARGQCLYCHAKSGGGIQWRQPPKAEPEYRWTSFSHGPHTNVSDCQDCHTWNTCYDGNEAFRRMYHPLTVEAVEKSARPTGGECEGKRWNFAPIQKDRCASCHASESVDGSCLECHAYHVRRRWTSRRG